MTDLVKRLLQPASSNDSNRQRREAAAEIEHLEAVLKEAEMLLIATAAYHPNVEYRSRLDAWLLETRRALESKE